MVKSAGSGTRYPISVRNCRYSPASIPPMTRARCHLSIWACKSARRASNSSLRPPRSATTLSTPAQKLSGSIPVPGMASVVMKSYSVRDTRRFPTATRSVMFSSLKESRLILSVHPVAHCSHHILDQVLQRQQSADRIVGTGQQSQMAVVLAQPRQCVGKRRRGRKPRQKAHG